MYSDRFKLEVRLTQHARARMIERGVDEELLLDLVETGTAKYKDEHRLWVFKHYPERDDNLICAAVVIENALIVKTVMHYFTLEG